MDKNKLIRFICLHVADYLFKESSERLLLSEGDSSAYFVKTDVLLEHRATDRHMRIYIEDGKRKINKDSIVCVGEDLVEYSIDEICNKIILGEFGIFYLEEFV